MGIKSSGFHFMPFNPREVYPTKLIFRAFKKYMKYSKRLEEEMKLSGGYCCYLLTEII